ncbi:MAG: hypothetical protein ABI238_00125 [Terrimesophilobacter sp.]
MMPGEVSSEVGAFDRVANTLTTIVTFLVVALAANEEGLEKEAAELRNAVDLEARVSTSKISARG